MGILPEINTLSMADNIPYDMTIIPYGNNAPSHKELYFFNQVISIKKKIKIKKIRPTYKY